MDRQDRTVSSSRAQRQAAALVAQYVRELAGQAQPAPAPRGAAS